MIWKFYRPDNNETAEDARELLRPLYPLLDAEDAARLACERDYSEHDGWERGDTPFSIVVIAPDGTESRFQGWHEPSVDHMVAEDD